MQKLLAMILGVSFFCGVTASHKVLASSKEEAITRARQELNAAEKAPEPKTIPFVDRGQTLERQFGQQIPESLKIEVSLDDIDEKKIKESYEILGNSSFKPELDLDVRKLGVASTISLWGSGYKLIKMRIQEILERGLNEFDLSKVSITVNSSPVPMINAVVTDRNSKQNRWMKDGYERALKAFERKKAQQLEERTRSWNEESYEEIRAQQPKLIPPKIPKYLPKDEHLKISMSLGMMASFKNVDEMAGQIYKAVSKADPKVYGYNEDHRFLELKNTLTLLDQAFGKKQKKHRYMTEKEEQRFNDYHNQKNLMWSELAAMERLLEAGYNIWALYKYEDRMNRWLQDVYEVSSAHKINRIFLYNIKDISNPFKYTLKDRETMEHPKMNLRDKNFSYRLQVLFSYVGYLQGSERGGERLNTRDTKFSYASKRMQWGMKLYTTSFFSGGLYTQIPLVGVGFGAFIAGITFPSWSHSAFAAVTNTMDSVWKGSYLENVSNVASDKISSLTSKVMNFSNQYLDNSYLGAKLSEFMHNSSLEYYHMLATGGFAIGSYYLMKNLPQLTEYYRVYSKEVRKNTGKSLQTKFNEIQEELRQSPESFSFENRHGVVTSTKEVFKSHARADQRFFMSVIESAVDISTRFLVRIEKAKQEKSNEIEIVESVSKESFIEKQRKGLENQWRRIRKDTALLAGSTVVAMRWIRGDIVEQVYAVPRRAKKVGIGLTNTMGQIFISTPVALGQKTINMLDELQNSRTYSLENYVKKIENLNKKEEADKEALRAQKDLIAVYHKVVESPEKASAEEFSLVWQELLEATLRSDSKAHVESMKNHFIKLSISFKKHIESGNATLRSVGEYFAVWVMYDALSLYHRPTLNSQVNPFSGGNTYSVYGPIGDLKKNNHHIFSVFEAISNWMELKGYEFYNIGTDIQLWAHKPKSDVRLMFRNTKNKLKSKKNYTFSLDPKELKIMEKFKSIEDFTYHSSDILTFFDEYLPIIRNFSRYIELGRNLDRLTIKEMREFLSISSLAGSMKFSGTDFYRANMYDRFVPYHRLKIIQAIFHQDIGAEEKIDLLLSVFDEFVDKDLWWKPKTGTQSFLSALEEHLSTMKYSERLFILQGILDKNMPDFGKRSSINKLKKRLEREVKALSSILLEGVSSIADLKRNIELFYNSSFSHFDSAHIKNEISKVSLEAILNKPSLIRNTAELSQFFEYHRFWSTDVKQANSTAIEKPILQLFGKSSGNQNTVNIAADYNPVLSRKIHRMATKRLKALGGFSAETELEAKLEFWKLISSRGVSTVSDALLSEVLEEAKPEIEKQVKTLAVDEGRVLDQKIKDKYALEALYQSDEYKELMNSRPGNSSRDRAIKNLAHIAQYAFKHMGTAYENFLEESSLKSQATYREAMLFNKYKTKTLARNLVEKYAEGDSEFDERIKAFGEILPHIKSWSKRQQSRFVLYLRGSLSAKEFPFIAKQFPIYGPDRVRRMYQELSVVKRTALLNLYLKETILAKGNIKKGEAKWLLDEIIDEARDKEAKRYAKELVDALLQGIDKAGNEPFQLVVLSALSAMDAQKESSVGETMKVILEQFPGVGPKIAQFLVPTNVLSEDINQVLRGAQDASLPPTHFEMYGDAARILKEKKLPFRIIKSLGSGSMKYTYLAEYLSSGDQMVMQVFREDIQYNSKLYIDILRQTVASLISKDAKRWSFLEVVVEGAVSAVEKEKRYSREAAKNSIAMHRVYRSFSDTNFVVEVPTQEQLRSRFLSADLALGENFFKLEAYDKVMTGIKIMEMEADILFSDKDVIWYDTDRHAGNYLIEKLEKSIGPQYKISPIDFGQLTFIRKQQRENVLRLFSLAKIASMYGANPWLNNEIAELLQLDKNETKQLKKRMNSFFDGPRNLKDLKKTPVLTYYELLSVINKSVKRDRSDSNFSGGKLRNAYADFVRAIVQFNQYQNELEKVAPEVMKNLEFRSPISILADSLSTQMEQDLKNIRFTGWQRAKAGLVDAYRWVKAKTSQSEYVKLNLRVSKEEIEGFTALAEKERLSEQKTKVQRLSKHESKTALDALLKDRVTDPKSCKVAL